MAKIETSIDIDRPIATVWDYVTDLHNAKDWSTEVVETTYSGDLQLGATGVDTRRWGKREVQWEWTVTNAVARFNFDEISPAATRVACVTTLRPSGWWRFMSPLIAAEGKKADETQFAKVKSILEGSAEN